MNYTKKVILDLAVSLDNFVEGPNGEIDWCIMDDDMDLQGFLESIDTIFYGRVSYDMWGNYQPVSNTSETESSIWSAVHSKKKYVFSGNSRQDQNATFITSDFMEKVGEIQQQAGGDIWLYGGSRLVKTFISLNLIDMYRISVHPVLLGKGKPLFEELKDRINLSLVRSNAFKSGVVQLIYQNGNKQRTTEKNAG